MQLKDITPDSLLLAFLVVLALLGAYTTIMGAVKTYREEKQRKDAPVTTMEEQVRRHDEQLQREHDRVDDLEGSNRIIMRALMALLSHEINGNSDDRLRASFDEIQQYLINR